MVGTAVNRRPRATVALSAVRGAMNLPFGNASTIKHCRKDAQPSWARLALETRSGHPGSEGVWGREEDCLAPAVPGETAEPFPPSHEPPALASCSSGVPAWDQACPAPCKEGVRRLAHNAPGWLLRGSEPPLSWAHFPKSLQASPLLAINYASRGG